MTLSTLVLTNTSLGYGIITLLQPSFLFILFFDALGLHLNFYR